MPVIMHLLQRRKPRPVPYSMVRFLQKAVSKTRRSRHLTQLLILLFRVLILLLLAMAFARPKLSFAPWLPKGARTVVIVLDGSASMRVRYDEGTAFSYAQDWIEALIGSLDEGDRVAVVVPGAAEPLVVFPAVSDHKRVLATVKELAPGYASVDLVSALKDTLTRMEFGNGMTGVEIHLFSDFQTSAWDSPRAADLGGQIAGHDLAFFLNQVTPPVVVNAGVDVATFAPPAIIGDGAFNVKVQIQASVDFTGENTARLLVGGEETASQSFKVNDGAVVEAVQLAGKVAGAGEGLTGQIALAADSLSVDNTHYFSLPRISGVPVLLVDGGGDGGGSGRDTFFLRNALAPGRRPNTILIPETSDWRTFLGRDLGRYGVLLISNPPDLRGSAAVAIEDFVNNGGYAIIFPGESGNTESSLAAIGPLASLKVQVDSFPEAELMAVLPSAPPRPIEERLSRIMPGALGIALRKRLLFEETPELCETLYRYADEFPFMIRMPVGPGHLAVVSVSANRDWSEWPLTPFFVILLQELLKGAVQENVGSLMTTVGGVLALDWPEDAVNLEFDLLSPVGTTERLTVSRTSNLQPVLIRGFDQPGIYQLSRRDKTLQLAVNVAPEEGRLSYATRQRLSGDLRTATLYFAKGWQEHQVQLGNLRHGRPLWPLLLLLAFVIAIVEELFANYRSRARALPLELQRILTGTGGAA